MITLLTIVAAIVADVAYAVYAGFILTVMWGWFIVPVFDVAGLTLIAGAGIIMMASLLKMNIDLDDLEGSFGEVMIKAFSVFGYKVLAATVFWGTAWVLLQVV